MNLIKDYFNVSFISSEENVVSTASTTVVSLTVVSAGVVSVDCEQEANTATAKMEKITFFMVFFKYYFFKTLINIIESVVLTRG